MSLIPSNGMGGSAYQRDNLWIQILKQVLDYKPADIIN
jgi:hypothetical protein